MKFFFDLVATTGIFVVRFIKTIPQNRPQLAIVISNLHVLKKEFLENFSRYNQVILFNFEILP